MGNVEDAFMRAVATNPELYKHYDSPAAITKILPAIGTIAGTGTGAAGAEKAIMQM